MFIITSEIAKNFILISRQNLFNDFLSETQTEKI